MHKDWKKKKGNKIKREKGTEKILGGNCKRNIEKRREKIGENDREKSVRFKRQISLPYVTKQQQINFPLLQQSNIPECNFGRMKSETRFFTNEDGNGIFYERSRKTGFLQTKPEG